LQNSLLQVAFVEAFWVRFVAEVFVAVPFVVVFNSVEFTRVELRSVVFVEFKGAVLLAVELSVEFKGSVRLEVVFVVLFVSVKFTNGGSV